MINLVIDILKANSTLTALVPSTRIYPLIQLQGGTIPAVVVQLVSTNPNDTQDRVSEYDDNAVQITSIADNPAEAWAISEAVRAAIDGYTGGSIAQIRFQSQATDIFEGTEVFSVTQGYSCHLKRDAGTLPIAIAGLGLFNLDDINDVTLDSPLDRQALVYDEATSTWINDGIGQVVIPVRNPSRDDIIAKGTVIKATGAQGDRILVAPFEPDTDDMKYLVGIASEELGITTATKDGHAQVYGELRALDTDDYEVGDVLYAAAGGTLSTTENQYPIAIVTRKQENTGRIFIRMWTPGKGYHQRYRTEAAAEMFVGVGATVELYYTATADGDGFVTQDLTATPAEGNVEERVLRYKSGAFGDSGTTTGYTDAGLATDATYAEMLTAFNNLLATESAPITIYATRTEVAGAPSFIGLLNESYGSGAAAAYSVRRLNGNYTGAAIEVERSSDNTTQDIGFDVDGNLDESALTTFCTGTVCKVRTWYDQSVTGGTGSGNDAVQTTHANQPTIYTGGAIVKENGRVAVHFDGSDDYLPVGTVDVKTAFVIAKADVSGGSQPIFGASSGLVQFLRTQSDYDLYNNFGTMSVSGNPDQKSLIYALINGSGSELAVNGGTATTGTQANDVFGNFAIGNERSSYYDGKQQEIVIYDSNKSTDRTSIESNIGDYFTQNTPLLDTYTGAAAAYSLRKLRTAYSGSAIRVRRASDNAEQDIGFNVFGELDTTSLATFCAGTNGFVKTWYDQANSNDATQTITGYQPKIYDSATGVVTENGKTAVQFDAGSNTNLRLENYTFDMTNVSSMLVAQAAGTGGYTIIDAHETTVNREFAIGVNNGSVGTAILYDGNASVSGDVIAQFDDTFLVTMFATSATTNDAFINGVAATASIGAGTTPNTTDNIRIGQRGSGSADFTGVVFEFVVYFSDQSANRTGIESNINTYYSIYA